MFLYESFAATNKNYKEEKNMKNKGLIIGKYETGEPDKIRMDARKETRKQLCKNWALFNYINEYSKDNKSISKSINYFLDFLHETNKKNIKNQVINNNNPHEKKDIKYKDISNYRFVSELYKESSTKDISELLKITIFKIQELQSVPILSSLNFGVKGEIFNLESFDYYLLEHLYFIRYYYSVIEHIFENFFQEILDIGNLLSALEKRNCVIKRELILKRKEVVKEYCNNLQNSRENIFIFFLIEIYKICFTSEYNARIKYYKVLNKNINKKKGGIELEKKLDYNSHLPEYITQTELEQLFSFSKKISQKKIKDNLNELYYLFNGKNKNIDRIKQISKKLFKVSYSFKVNKVNFLLKNKLERKYYLIAYYVVYILNIQWGKTSKLKRRLSFYLGKKKKVEDANFRDFKNIVNFLKANTVSYSYFGEVLSELNSWYKNYIEYITLDRTLNIISSTPKISKETIKLYVKDMKTIEDDLKGIKLKNLDEVYGIFREFYEFEISKIFS